MGESFELSSDRETPEFIKWDMSRALATMEIGRTFKIALSFFFVQTLQLSRVHNL